MTANDRRPPPRKPDDAADELLADWEDAKRTKLSPDEIAGVRQLLKRKDRWDWIGSSIKVWAVWLVAVIGGYNIGLDALARLVKSLSGK